MIEKAKLLVDELEIKLYGEAGSVDEDVITESLSLLQKCKINKKHISVALCANADGSYKLAPLIISKYAKLQCFKNWLQDFDHQMLQKHRGQYVFLLLDNCSSHKLDELTLQYVDVHFLPKNTTSRIQPIDTGIIITFKRAYHCFHLQWMLEQVEADNFIQNLKMDVLQVILYIIKGWGEVLAETICNCWHHTKILLSSANLSDDLCEAGDSRLENLIRSLNTLCLPNAMETDEFLNFNKDQIIKKLAYVFRNDESVEVMDEGNTEVMDDSVEPTVVSGSSALNSLENVQMFLLQQEGSGNQLKLINFLEKFIRKMISSSA
ncbi:2758_t:CDS:2 [Cetraspora pellucida]|uniref:2758_t:CDS:1 n=1 Tax=Cetraspora pellucida TaxID=1433469 RepID=A0A9N9IX57_9GLOM|nr:2758_t:CDS:2 [Cetraspora pellucida]